MIALERGNGNVVVHDGLKVQRDLAFSPEVRGVGERAGRLSAIEKVKVREMRCAPLPRNLYSSDFAYRNIHVETNSAVGFLLQHRFGEGAGKFGSFFETNGAFLIGLRDRQRGNSVARGFPSSGHGPRVHNVVAQVGAVVYAADHQIGSSGAQVGQRINNAVGRRAAEREMICRDVPNA